MTGIRRRVGAVWRVYLAQDDNANVRRQMGFAAGTVYGRSRVRGTAVLDQAKLRGANRRFEVETLDLGNEPPLSVDGGTGGPVGRRRISVQWFCGTILTGLCGAALMGGAVFASLDGETNFAAAPERVEMALSGAIGGLAGRLTGIRKTDRLATFTEPSVARQMMRVPTITRVRDRELVRTRSFVRISGNLSLALSELSANIPPFNPQKLLTDGVANSDDAPAAEPDAEVSFVTCDFVPNAAKGRVAPATCDINSLLSRVKPATLLPVDEVISRVRDIASAARTGSPLLASADAASAASLKLSYAAEGDIDTYVGFEARVVPENITLLPKKTAANDWSERLVVAKKSETVGSILRELGAAPDEIKALIAVLGRPARDGGLKEGQKLRVLLTPAGLGHMRPLRVVIAGESAIEAAAALSDAGKYVAVDVRNVATEVAEADEEAT